MKWTTGGGTVDGNPANQLRLVVYPIIFKGFHNIPGGARFQPSTVSRKIMVWFLLQQFVTYQFCSDFQGTGGGLVSKGFKRLSFFNS